MSAKTDEDLDSQYVDVVPFYGDDFCIEKHATTSEMQRLKREAFEVTPTISELYLW